MNDVDKTARLAQYRSHVDMGMAGYESDMDQSGCDLVSPRHAMRMDDLPLSTRLRHMTARELARLVGEVMLIVVSALLFIAASWVLYDIQRYGLLG